MKKLFSILLCVALLATLTPSAFAATTSKDTISDTVWTFSESQAASDYGAINNITGGSVELAANSGANGTGDAALAITRNPSGGSNVYIDFLNQYQTTLKPHELKVKFDFNVNNTNAKFQFMFKDSSNVSVGTTMKNTIALYASKNCALVRGAKTVIDASKPNIIPYWDADTAMIPLKFFAQSLGGTVSWDSQTSLLTMEVMGRQVKLKSGETAIEIDGQSLALAHAPQTKDGTAYVPAEDICELIGVYCLPTRELVSLILKFLRMA